MNAHFVKLAVLSLIPAILNIVLSILIFLYVGFYQFKGFIIGTVTSAVIAVVWLIQVGLSLQSNVINLLKMMLKGYAIKFIILLIFIIGTYLLFSYDKLYFILAFFVGTSFNLIVEVRFYMTLNRVSRREVKR